MRPLVLDGPRGSLSQLTFVPLAPLVGGVLENRCFTTPHDLMLRCPIGIHGRRELAHVAAGWSSGRMARVRLIPSRCQARCACVLQTWVALSTANGQTRV